MTQGERSTSPPSPPTLCGHPPRCAAIPGIVKPSPTLWGPVLMGRYHASHCAARTLLSGRPSNRCASDDQTWVPAGSPSKPPLDRHKIHHDTCKDQDSSGQHSNHKYCMPVPRHCTIGHTAQL
jgi:hypothetical protein